MSTIKISFTYGGKHTNKFGARVVEVPVTNEENPDVKISDIREALSISKGKQKYHQQFIEIYNDSGELDCKKNLSYYIKDDTKRKKAMTSDNAIQLEWRVEIPITINFKIMNKNKMIKMDNKIDVYSSMTYLEKYMQDKIPGPKWQLTFAFNGTILEMKNGISIWKSLGLGKNLNSWAKDEGITLECRYSTSKESEIRYAQDSEKIYVKLTNTDTNETKLVFTKKEATIYMVCAVKAKAFPAKMFKNFSISHHGKEIKDITNKQLLDIFSYKELEKAKNESSPAELSYHSREKTS